MFRKLTVLTAVVSTMTASVVTAVEPETGWRKPPPEVMEVLHAPRLPSVWTAPTGAHMLLADPVLYPSLAEMAGTMHVLAGIRVDPSTNNIHGRHGSTSPRRGSTTANASGDSSAKRFHPSRTRAGTGESVPMASSWLAAAGERKR